VPLLQKNDPTRIHLIFPSATSDNSWSRMIIYGSATVDI
jgi:hypothetical protein